MAKLLSRENMEISLMDERQDRLGDLDADYDLLTKVGSPTSIRDLKDIGVNGCDLFIAVTPHETENMTACLMANQLGAKKTLARIDNYEYLLPENKKFFENMGLNHLIYPEVLAANEIEESLKTNWMRYHLHLCQGGCMYPLHYVFSFSPFRISRLPDTTLKRGSDAGEVVTLIHSLGQSRTALYITSFILRMNVIF